MVLLGRVMLLFLFFSIASETILKWRSLGIWIGLVFSASWRLRRQKSLKPSRQKQQSCEGRHVRKHALWRQKVAVMGRQACEVRTHALCRHIGKNPFAQQKIQALLRPGAFKASEGPSSPTLLWQTWRHTGRQMGPWLVCGLSSSVYQQGACWWEAKAVLSPGGWGRRSWPSWKFAPFITQPWSCSLPVCLPELVQGLVPH